MSQEFDVIVVGARCSGSPLAALLARRGVKVALVEQASFPSDTLSTHIFEAQALTFLDRLGVIEKIRATGAPFLDRVDLRQEDLEFVDPDSAAFRRRRRYGIGASAAARSDPGSDRRGGGRRSADGEQGDGTARGSGSSGWRAGRTERLGDDASGTAGCRRRRSQLDDREPRRGAQVQRHAERAVPLLVLLRGVEPDPDPAFVFHRWGNRMVIATHADSGLYQVILIPDLVDLPRFRDDLEGSFMEYACSCRPVAQALSSARRTGKFFGMLCWEGFFREASGPGWVLVGDAGNFKDPTPGQGIQDAFRQVDALVPAIVTALDGSEESIDREMAAWGGWRDRDAAEHYWLATDMGKAGSTPAVVPEMERRLLEQGKIGTFLDLFYSHRARPSQVFTPPRLLGATARLLARRGCDRRALLGEVGTLLAEDFQRKRLNRQPVYAVAGTALDAGPSDVDSAAA